MEKKLYVSADAEFISFASEDILMNSPNNGGGDNGGSDNEDWDDPENWQ